MKKNTVFEDVLTTLTRYFVVLVIAVVLLICISGVRFVKSGEVAVVLRFGKLVGDNYEEQVKEPGLFFAFPYIIDEVISIPVGSVMEQTVTTHYTEGEMMGLDSNGYVITGDQNIVVVSASVKYNITDAVAYALQVKDADRIINATVSNAMIESASRRSADGILTSEKEVFATEIKELVQKKLDAIGVGVTISTLELIKVGMPEEVRETYEQVNAATVQAETFMQEAAQYRANLIPNAEATKNSLISMEYAAQNQALADVEDRLSEFRGVLAECERSPGSIDAIKARIYTEKVREMIKKLDRVILVPDGNSHIVIP